MEIVTPHLQGMMNRKIKRIDVCAKFCSDCPPFKEDRRYDLIMTYKLLRDMKPKKHARCKPHPSAYHKDFELLFKEEGTLNKRESFGSV